MNEIDARTVAGALLIGIPIGGEIQAGVAYGYYLQKWTSFTGVLPNDGLGVALGVLGIISLFMGIGLLARRRAKV